MALPLAFAACTNDEFESNSMSQVQNGELVTLPDNYLLAGMMGGDAATRSIYNETAFAWLPFDGVTPDEIGLCWRGGEYTSNGSVVYTNYKFTHYGWLGKDEVKPDLDCYGKLLNGRKLTDLSSNQDALLAGTWAVADASEYPNLKVDAKNGLFHTDNSTIFKGDYIVYYPYNDKFAEVGNIPATAPANIKRDIYGLTDKNYTKELAKEVFVAGTMNGVDGGQQNGVFSTNFVSGGIVVKIKNTGAGDLNIHKVILLADNGFATEVKLDAAKIAAGAKGAALYAEEPSEFANTLVAEFYDSKKSNAQADLNIKSNETQRVAFAVLPTTTSTALKNTKVILVNAKGDSYMVESNLQKLVSLSEGWNVIEVNAKFADFKEAAYAYDTESLIKELVKHNTATGKRQTINVLNKITLDPQYKFTLPYGSSADSEGTLQSKFKMPSDRSIYIGEDLTLSGKGSIVVPANLQLVFKSVGTEDKPVTVKFDIPVITENKGCCGDYNGTIVFRTASEKYGKYEFSKIQNEGTIYLGSDLNGAVNITVDELVNNGGLVNAYGVNKDEAEKSSQVTINKLTNTYVERDTETDAEKVNNGRVNIVAKFWDPKTEQKEAAPANLSKCMNVTIGELTNNKDAYVLVGKRTYLDVAGSSNNAGKIKVETASVNDNTKDGQMHIDGSISNTGLIENYGVINNEGRLANANENGEIVDHVGCQFGGNKITAEPGEYICDVEDTNVDKEGDRLAYALGDNMPTTTVRFVGNSGTEKSDNSGNEDYYLYDLSRYNLRNANFIVATTNAKGVVLQGTTKAANNKGAAATINGKLTVEKGTALEISKIQLTVNEVVTVNGEMTIKSVRTDNAVTTDDVNAFTAKADVNVNGEKDNKALFTVNTFAKTAMNSNFNIANKYSSAIFNYATYSEIANVLNINGTFTRIVSTGGQTANPAQVWCGSYTKGADADIPNGLPQQR